MTQMAVRARPSESEYTLMDLVREFPDDASCLEWLWLKSLLQRRDAREVPKVQDAPGV
jgi:hypothetical protein